MGDQELSDEEKKSKFDEIFQKLINSGIETVSKNIASIKTADGVVVDNPVFIKDFLDNCDKAVWDAIKEYLDTIKSNNTYNQIDLTCSNDACGKPFTTPFIFEQTNFFG